MSFVALSLSHSLRPPITATSQKKTKRSGVELAIPGSRSATAAAASDERMNHEEMKDTTEPSRDEALARLPTTVAGKGVILRSGRVRLPDKLIQYLNNEVAMESLYWQPDGQGFSIDCDKVQRDLLDKHFHGTKLSSFLRSLNRWGFKRLFVSSHKVLQNRTAAVEI
jgi:HSF-type DNA-binding